MTQIQLRRDTAANWASANPILASGEPAFETDTGVFKIGDGVTAYNSLSQLSASEIEELGNELNQLASTVTGLETSKQDKLTAGDNITIENNVISSTGGESYVLPAANDTTLGGVKVSTGSTSVNNASNIYIDSDKVIRLLDYPKVQSIEYTGRAGTSTQFGLINVNGTSMLGTSSNLGVTNNYSCYIHADGNSGEVVAQAPKGIGSNAYGRLQIKDYNNGASNYCELFLNANKNAWNGVIDPHNRITSNTDILEISRYIDGYQVYHNIDTGNLQDNIVAGTNITTSVADDGKVTINSTVDTSSFASQSSVDAINSALNGLKFWKGTQTEYDGITSKDENTLYIITG